ncbi:hypothetical protein PAAG_12543 [Paracoccidioides lutzii Pb01]|uniref:Uncharacterized protein n=1 Tax=Paracoccidioides lutzii (strain ATCC MYA-826 / Pb01) TaxID=502779 RepID=A0A0A2UZW8_PARBA|nr:hypothetical protein PAAG_12543 [Paracoccidioides lutzii Pb01]KGQ00783.1 hypothetical protein PAAG_12543 [Paracoccidioides lutzii Pb01]
MKRNKSNNMKKRKRNGKKNIMKYGIKLPSTQIKDDDLKSSEDPHYDLKTVRRSEQIAPQKGLVQLLAGAADMGYPGRWRTGRIDELEKPAKRATIAIKKCNTREVTCWGANMSQCLEGLEGLTSNENRNAQRRRDVQSNPGFLEDEIHESTRCAFIGRGNG